MRSRTILCAIVMLPLPLLAQPDYAIDRGSFIVDGRASFSSTGRSGSDRLTSISINPAVSYFVVPHLAVGGSLSYFRVSIGESSSTSWGVGPRLAYYFGGRDSKSFPFLSSTFFYQEFGGDDSRIQLQFSGGVTFMIAKNVGVTGSAFYTYVKESFTGSDETGNAIGAALGLTIFAF